MTPNLKQNNKTIKNCLRLIKTENVFDLAEFLKIFKLERAV